MKKSWLDHYPQKGTKKKERVKKQIKFEGIPSIDDLLYFHSTNKDIVKTYVKDYKLPF